MYSYKKDDMFIDLKEVCKRIKCNDIRTAIKWCKKSGIPIIRKGRHKITYRFLVDVESDKEIVKFFKSKYPESWRKMYQLYLNNDTIEYLLETQEKNITDTVSKIN
ncbi:hypothetical protein GCM10007384_20530 [Aquimarina muelleri]|uniref:Uncharacterized protein n=2 Tax=Aquimarina muelleri TaxID=279356 RepID=A0A918N351_9FLAO|nr:hypothetical protein GCM10007384_20530 [Aquimarina muelleri]